MSPRLLASLTLTALLFAGPALAQHNAALQLELNALQPSETGCRVSFLATNQLGTSLDKAGFEMAFFGPGGSIDRLVALEFKALPQGKTKVLQFEIAKLACEDISRVLVNDVVSCVGAELAATACLDDLETRSALATPFGV